MTQEITVFTLGAILWRYELMFSSFCLVTDRRTDGRADSDAYEPNAVCTGELKYEVNASACTESTTNSFYTKE